MKSLLISALDEQNIDYKVDSDSDELHLPCPECPPEKSHKFKLYFNTEKLVGHCWVCESNYSLGKLVRAFGLQGIRVKSAKRISPAFRRLDSLRSVLSRKAKHINLPERRPLSNYPSALKYVLNRDVTPQMIKLFGLAVCSDDFNFEFYGRLIIPIRDHKGLVVSYLGRALMQDVVPKYLVYSNSPVFDFLFGVHLIKQHTTAVLFEGTFSVLRTHAIFQKVFGQDLISVASFSHHLSQRQERVLQERGITKVIIFYDGDSLEISRKLEFRLKRWAKVGRVVLDDLIQPDDLTPQHIVDHVQFFVEDFKKTKMEKVVSHFKEV